MAEEDRAINTGNYIRQEIDQQTEEQRRNFILQILKRENIKHDGRTRRAPNKIQNPVHRTNRNNNTEANRSSGICRRRSNTHGIKKPRSKHITYTTLRRSDKTRKYQFGEKKWKY